MKLAYLDYTGLVKVEDVQVVAKEPQDFINEMIDYIRKSSNEELFQRVLEHMKKVLSVDLEGEALIEHLIKRNILLFVKSKLDTEKEIPYEDVVYCYETMCKKLA